MKIGINALFLRPGKNGGIETYFRELIKALVIAAPHHEYIVYVPSEGAGCEVPQTVRLVVAPICASVPHKKYAFEQLVLPRLALDDGLDLLHSLAYVAPLCVPCKSVVTVHDLNFRAFGEELGMLRRAALEVFCFGASKSADAVIAVSAFTQNLLRQEMGLRDSKLFMIHEAGAKIDSRAPEPIVLPDRPYITSFGGRFPNKNVARLLLAFEKIALGSYHDLVLIGEMHPSFVPVLEQLPSIVRRRVHWLGHVSDGQVVTVIRGADAYIHPSIYEGFGMPILEAQSVGVPIAASNVSSLPEIAGDAAVYFDPRSVDDMTRALREICVDRKLRQELVERGFRNVGRFSWAGTAQKTLDVYTRVCGRSARAW